MLVFGSCGSSIRSIGTRASTAPMEVSRSSDQQKTCRAKTSSQGSAARCATSCRSRRYSQRHADRSRRLVQLVTGHVGCRTQPEPVAAIIRRDVRRSEDLLQRRGARRPEGEKPAYEGHWNDRLEADSRGQLSKLVLIQLPQLVRREFLLLEELEHRSPTLVGLGLWSQLFHAFTPKTLGLVPNRI